MNYSEAKKQALGDRWRFLKLRQGERTLVGFKLLKAGGIPWNAIDEAVMRNTPGTFHFECYENMKDQNPRIISFSEEEKLNNTYTRTPHPEPAPVPLADSISPQMVTKLMELERVKVELIQKTAQCEQQVKLIKNLNDKIEELEIELSQVELDDPDGLEDGGTIWQDLAAGLAPHVLAAAPGLLDALLSKLKPQTPQPAKPQSNGYGNPVFHPQHETKTTRNGNAPADVEYFE
jgi:hypothetical protein